MKHRRTQDEFVCDSCYEDEHVGSCGQNYPATLHAIMAGLLPNQSNIEGMEIGRNRVESDGVETFQRFESDQE